MKRPIVNAAVSGQEQMRSLRRWALPIAVGLICVAVFWPCRGYGFLNWDDDRNFVQNEHFRGPIGEELGWAWQTYHLGVWQPLAWIMLLAEGQWAEFGPRTFHVVSIILHAINCVVLALVIARVLRIRRDGQANKTGVYVAAALAAALFGVHPLRVEPVAWVSSQAYLPAAALYLFAMGAYLRVSEARGGKRYRWLATCLALYCCAIMFKAAAISLPFVFLILDWYVGRERREDAAGASASRLVLEKVPFFAVAIVASIWAAEAKDFNESRIPFNIAGLDGRISQATYGLVAYFVRTIVAIHLTPYDRLPSDLSLLQPRHMAAFLAVVGLSTVLFIRRRRWPGTWSAWLAYCVILLPNLGLVQISQQMTADRYSYLAMMPVMAWLGGGLLRFWPRGKAGLVPAGVAIVLLLGFASRGQMKIWRDSRSLWSAALRLDPGSAVAACNLGHAFIMEERYDEAVSMLRQAIELEPEFSFAHSNLGVAYLARDEPAEAVAPLERALAAEPPLSRDDRAKTHASLGAAYARLRKDDLAWKHTLKARELGFVEAEKMIQYLSQFSKPPVEE